MHSSIRAIRAMVTVTAFTGMVALAPGVANAVRSYQGSDYSEDYNTKKSIRTCDQESDSTPVKGVYDMNSGSDGDVKDSDGNNGVCGSKTVSTTSNYIMRHKTCEYRSFWPDECGNWQAT